jgi:hypothetical protein
MSLIKERKAIVLGARFSRLVAMHQSESRGKKAFWFFICDCGERVERAAGDVLSGRTKSCGCLRREMSASRKPDDLSGERYGRLRPVRRLDKSMGKSRWICLCDCGKTTEVAASELRKGSTVSCGCYRAERASIGNSLNIQGQTFGRLTAIEKTSSGSCGVTWSCRCACGKDHKALAADLSGGRVISCGCAVLDKPGLINSALNSRKLASNHSRRAKARGAGGSFTALQVSDLFKKQRGRCACCKKRVRKYHRDHRLALANGGDNSIRNIELLCSLCNLKKGAKDEIIWANQNGRLL